MFDWITNFSQVHTNKFLLLSFVIVSKILTRVKGVSFDLYSFLEAFCLGFGKSSS